MPIPIHLIDADLEKGVLGRLLLEPATASALLDLTSEHFETGAHKIIFEAIKRMYQCGHPITTLSVGTDLYNRELLEQIGGPSFLGDLVEYHVLAFHQDFAFNRLCDLATFRRTLRKIYPVIAKLESPGSTLEDIQELSPIIHNAEPRAGSGVRLRSISEVVKEYPGGIDRFLSPFAGERFLRLPWTKAQNGIGGLWPGEVMVLGGRPGSGKSAVGLQLARYNAKEWGMTPAIFNLEMSDQQTIYRTICARAGVSMARFRMGEISEGERKAIYEELRSLAGENVLLCDRPTLTINQIANAIRKAVLKQNVDLAIIDYLQLAEAGINSDNRQQEVAYISRICKLIAMECKIPLIVLAQLSRKSEDQNREPGLSDLRESGSIEQDADIVMFTYRKTEATASGPRDTYKLLFRKVRNGPDGACPVRWDPKMLEFRELTTEIGPEVYR